MHVALFAPMGNMSLDSQVALLPYESCFLFLKGDALVNVSLRYLVTC